MYARDRAMADLAIQLTYLDLDTGKVTELRSRFAIAELEAFFTETTAVYLEWLRDRHRWRGRRDETIRSLVFPFAEYRPGQRELAVAAFRALARGGRLFLEAPTGIGKTISVLFPAVKAVGEGKVERIIYLTARTVGGLVAQKAFADLRKGGLRFHTLALTAKEKICVREGQPCDPRTCPLAIGYYDRVRSAMRAALRHDDINRATLEKVGAEHQVCPFELSLDLSLWVDAVICDYNYVFDPKVYLRRHFAEDAGDYAFLVDESHNLVDRAREMFSADLASGEIQEARRAIKEALPRCAKALSRLGTGIRRLCASGQIAREPVEGSNPAVELDLFPVIAAAASPSAEAARRPAFAAGPKREVSTLCLRSLPEDLMPLLDEALKETEAWLAQNQPAGFREQLLELYFRMHSFRRAAELYDERYFTIVEPGASVRMRFFCLDPSFLLRQALDRGKAAVLFSATLTPIDYYRKLLGGEPDDAALQLRSPFPPESFCVLLQSRIRTHFKSRGETLDAVVEAIGALVEARQGNYLVYLPSYQYLTAVSAGFRARYPALRALVQTARMNDAEREAFLAAFAVEHTETLLGFAVMGGVFGEGIDLVGDRLIGAVIVGVGLPQLCVERDLMRDYFQDRLGAGFDYAYSFPGMNRVLQATGRVIRSETDRGVVLLIDTRFAEPRYARLFPPDWRPLRVSTAEDIRAAARAFWRHSSQET